MNFKILDHGYVNFVEAWGSDERIIEAARMSTGKGFLGWGSGDYQCKDCNASWGKEPEHDCCKCGGDLVKQTGDEKLLRFLYENRHDTPFEMAGMVIEVQAPIFVFREWHRHRTQSYNEMSARYAPLPDLNYVPSVERLMANARGPNKQAGTTADAAALTEQNADTFRAILKMQYEDAQTFYEQSLKDGIPKELARVHLPVGRYSRMRASANLRNWLGFITLRSAPNAQWEIQQFSNAVASVLRILFPRTMQLFDEGKR